MVVYGVINGLLTIWFYWFAWPSVSRTGLSEAEYWAALSSHMEMLRYMILQGVLAAIGAVIFAWALADRVPKRWLVPGTLCVCSQGISNFFLFAWDAFGMGV